MDEDNVRASLLGYMISSGFRRGLGVQQVVAPRRKLTHSLSGARPAVCWPSVRHVSCTELDMRDCHSSNVWQVDWTARFEVGTVLLHDDDGLLEGVLSVDLFLELAGDGGVCYVSEG